MDNISTANVNVVNDSSNNEFSAGTYRFKNVANNEYMDSDDTTIKTAVLNSSSDRVWNVVETGNGLYNIDSNFANRGVLATWANNIVRGTSIEPLTIANNRNWTIESLGNNIYRFKNAFGSRGYLVVNLDTKQIEYTPWNGARSQWVLEPVNSNSAKNIDDQIITSSTKLYPNPIGSDLLNIAGLPFEQTTIEVVNIVGQKMISSTNSVDQVQLNVSSLKAEFYILLVKGNTTYKSIPFIKNKFSSHFVFNF